MYKKSRSFLLKILLISSIFVGVFQIGELILSANEENTNNKEVINQNFENINNSNISKTGLALSINIGLRYTDRNTKNAFLYSDILSINNLISKKNLINDDLINNHMILTNEYLNLLKTDLRKVLDTTVIDRDRLLSAIIEEYEYKYEDATLQISILSEIKDGYISDMNKANDNIENIKSQMSSDFENDDAISSKENIVSYLEEKNNYFYARSYVVYINQFLAEYTIMNNYNKKILDTLINNKDAIIKNSFVVLPDTGIEMLKELELIYDEKTFKQK